MADKTDAEIFAELMDSGSVPTPAATEPAAATPAPTDPGPVAANDPTPAQTEQVAPVVADPALNTTSIPEAVVPDWVQALPPEGREAWDAMNASYAETQQSLSRERQARAAVEGRLAPVQRKLSRVELELAQARQTSPREPVSPTGAAGTNPTNDSNLDSYFDSPAWKKFEAEFPEEADVQRKALQHVSTATSQRIQSLEDLVNKTVRPQLAHQAQDAEGRRIEQEKAALTESHPDWQEINTDPVFLTWLSDWVEAQPADVRAIYGDEAKFRKILTDSTFTSGLLDQYKRDLFVAEQYLANYEANHPAAVATTPAQTPTGAPAAPTARGVDPLLALSAAPALRHSPAPRAVDISGLPAAEQFAAVFEAIGGNR